MRLVDELAKLDTLRESGVLSQEEFDTEEANLLLGSLIGSLLSGKSRSVPTGWVEEPKGEGR
ncbi:MAG: SHOCT domain-containing protein [Acidimicrobiales bacterium]|jgi:hypothetical protein